MSKMIPTCFALAVSVFFLACDVRAQTGQESPPALNVRRDSTSEVVIPKSTPAQPGTDNNQHGPVEILSDTHGVDFGPYLETVVDAVRQAWYGLIPDEARRPVMKQGIVVIGFSIRKNGTVADMSMVTSSGDLLLDRAAWGGITTPNRFPPLPSEFKGDSLMLRFHFYYNPDKQDVTPPSQVAEVRPIREILPKYPKKARKAGIEGTVQVDVTVDKDGAVKRVNTTKGNLVLGEAASAAIRKWRFEPSRVDGKPVESEAHVEFQFQLNASQVNAQVVGTSFTR